MRDPGYTAFSGEWNQLYKTIEIRERMYRRYQ